MGNVPSAPKFDARAIEELAGARYDQRIFDKFSGDDGKITRDRVLGLCEHHKSADILFSLAGKATRDKGEVVLIDADWMIKWYETTKKKNKFVALPCRQELPSSAFIFARSCDRDQTDICVISYPWFTQQHPDPLGVHLSVIVPVLKLYQTLKKKKLAIFWDWCSLHQAYYAPSSDPPVDYFAESSPEISDRTPEQKKWFESALANSSEWFVNHKTLVLVQSFQADDSDFKLQIEMKDIMAMKEKDKDTSISEEDSLRKKIFDRLGIVFLGETLLVRDVKEGSDGRKGGVRSGFYFKGISAVLEDGTEDEILTDSFSEIVKQLKVFVNSRVRHPRLIFKRCPYESRGWCVFEQRLAELISPQDMILDIGHLMRTMKQVQNAVLKKTLNFSDFKKCKL